MKIYEIWEDLDEDGHIRQGVFAEINGQIIQFVRYDDDNNTIVVQIGDRVEQMSTHEIPNFVRNRLGTL